MFVGEKILVIGNGPSGVDLVKLLSKTVNRITWSQRSKFTQLPGDDENYQKITYKGAVKRFTETGADFVDNTHQTFSVIFYATGIKLY